MRLATSLVGRVAAASAFAAALGGIVAALSAGITARELVASHEAATLRSAAQEMVSELNEEIDGDPDDDEHHAPSQTRRTLPEMLEHELDDLDLRTARAAIHDHGKLIAGDPKLPEQRMGTCSELEREGSGLRLCTVQFRSFSLTLAVAAEAERSRSALLTRALLIGLLSGALLGGLLSYFIARWALLPLTVLRDRVRAVDPERPALRELAQPVPQIELEELRAAVASLVERLSDALSHAQAFAAEAAHELRTPLTVIAGELELLSADQSDESPELARVRRQVDELISLVQRLLVLARPAQHDARESDLVDSADVLAQVEAALTRPQRARLRLEPSDDVLVRGDLPLLRAMLLNAVENALKFSRGAVHVQSHVVGEHAQFDVRDEGPGVPESERERVFAPFYRSAAARAGTAEGHGLGLALIARVAQAHGGSARFLASEQGAHLRITLPLWSTRAAPT